MSTTERQACSCGSFCPEISRMTMKAPPTLQEIAMQNLLRDESLAISALENLPRVLFPTLFKEAITSGHNNTVRAMVAAWPFRCLPVGSLMRTLGLETLQAVLSGVDLLLTQKDRPRRWKLQVVEFGNVDSNSWNIWAVDQDPGCLTQVPPRKPGMQKAPVCGEKQLLKVVADFHLESHHLDEYHTLLMQWAQRRKGSMQLYCRKLQVWALPISKMLEMLKVREPDSIQELELNSWWKLGTLTGFAPDLGQMRNLHRLLRAGTHDQTYPLEDEEMEEKRVLQFISQFFKLQTLQHLHMNGIYFLRYHLKQLLRPLQVLLERVAGTLKSLVLEDCGMEDSQLNALLPALSRCTQLTEVSFYGNNFSLTVLKTLLSQTAPLSQLTLELYPAPVETYGEMGQVNPERFAQVCSHLMDTLHALRQPMKVSFATDVCLECDCRCFYSLGTTLCDCWQLE